MTGEPARPAPLAGTTRLWALIAEDRLVTVHRVGGDAWVDLFDRPGTLDPQVRPGPYPGLVEAMGWAEQETGRRLSWSTIPDDLTDVEALEVVKRAAWPDDRPGGRVSSR